MAPPVNSSSQAGGYNPSGYISHIQDDGGSGQQGYSCHGGGNSFPQQYGGGYGDPRSEYGAGEYEDHYPQRRGGERGLGGLLSGLLGGRRAGGSRIPSDDMGGRYGGDGGYMRGGGYPAQQQPQVEQPVEMGGGGGFLGAVLQRHLDRHQRHRDRDQRRRDRHRDRHHRHRSI